MHLEINALPNDCGSFGLILNLLGSRVVSLEYLQSFFIYSSQPRMTNILCMLTAVQSQFIVTWLGLHNVNISLALSVNMGDVIKGKKKKIMRSVFFFPQKVTTSW